MATDYSPEHLAAMTAEFDSALQALSIALPPEAETSAQLVTHLLKSSADWATASGSRAVGPFGAFLAGMHSPTGLPDGAEAGCARIDRCVANLSDSGAVRSRPGTRVSRPGA